MARWIATFLLLPVLALGQAHAGPILSGSFSGIVTSGSFQTN